VRIKRVRPSIVGLDLSYRASGVAIRDKKEYVFCVEIPRKRTDNVLFVIDQIVKGIIPNLIKGDQLIVEDYAFSHSASGIKNVSVGSVIRFLSWKVTGNHPVLVSPTTLKKFATGKGKSKKEHMLLALSKQTGKEFETSDEVDAWFLSEIGMYIAGNSILKGAQARKQALERVIKNNKQIIAESSFFD
jgi:Holliday junction resolvasome RuvABC endonuclease subunit